MALSADGLGIGRDEHYWDAPLCNVPTWNDSSLRPDLLLLAPHPDDEVLACGGLLQRCARSASIEVWMVTDGEACFGPSRAGRIRRFPIADVGAQRRKEAEIAHVRLGMHGARFASKWLGLPDGAVSGHQDTLYRALRARVTATTLLVAPLPDDGHPDHDSVGAVAQQVAGECGLASLSYPVWLWHWGDAKTLQARQHQVRRVELSVAEQCRKRSAIAAFESQITPISAESISGEAILPRRVLRHFWRPFEIFFEQ